jgi:hypothetical protein
VSAEENKALVFRYVEEVWNGHDHGAIDGLVSPGYVNHAVSTEEYRRGGARRAVEWMLSVFPDHRFDVEDAAADGQTVALRGTMVWPCLNSFAPQKSLRACDALCTAQHWHFTLCLPAHALLEMVRARTNIEDRDARHGAGALGFRPFLFR